MFTSRCPASRTTATRISPARAYTDTLSTTAPPINPDGLLASHSKNNQGYYVNTFAGGGTGLPLSSVMPQAHAGFADFAWGLVDFLLPIESIKEVVVQLSYLVTDPDKFEMDIFIVSAVDVLTIFPVAKPLKLFTTPLKAMMRFMPKKMRPHFAKALKQVMNRAKKGDFDVLWNLLPFMVLTAEMMSDEEMRKGLEFMFSTVNSAEDMLSWVDYLALPAGGWEGDELPEIDPFSSAPDTAALPLSFVVGQAYANKKKGFRVPTAALGAALIKASKRIAKGNADNLPQGLAELTKTLKSGKGKAFRKYVFNPSLLAVSGGFAARQGIRRLKNFLVGKTNARYSAPAILAMTAFMEWQMECGEILDQQAGLKGSKTPAPEDKVKELEDELRSLECNGKGLRGASNREAVNNKIYAKAFADILSGELDESIDDDANRFTVKDGHGQLFHLGQLTRFQLAHIAGAGKQVKAVEGYRRVWLYTDKKGFKDSSEASNEFEAQKAGDIIGAYTRNVDLILGDDQEEQWIELKSYEGKSKKDAHLMAYLKNKRKFKKGYITPWGLEKNRTGGESLHKQFVIDRSAAHVKHARLKKDKNEENQKVTLSNDFLWIFQKFNVSWKTPKGAKKNAFNVEIEKAGAVHPEHTIRRDMAKTIQQGEPGQKKEEFASVNMGNKVDTGARIVYADVKQLLSGLESLEFVEAGDALELLGAE